MTDFAMREYKSLLSINFCNNNLTKIPKLFMEAITSIVVDYNEIVDLTKFF